MVFRSDNCSNIYCLDGLAGGNNGDGYVYTFGKDVNIEWRHGIPQVKEFNEKGRISIIAWGKVTVLDEI